MAAGKSQFDEFLAQEVKESKGLYFPVKTGLLVRMMTKKAPCSSLHPNPEDEFCSPDVGPNYKIISAYQDEYLNNIKKAQNYFSGEPIIVERLHPDGYRIINGHHRWAAAMRLGQPSIPICIVNLTHDEDVEKILRQSGHTKRAAFDLDEVVFSLGDDPAKERMLPFPWNKLYKERLRLGVPALFHFLSGHGYDIWVFTAQYYSTDTIQHFFQKYHVKVDGVMTATGKRTRASDSDGKKLEKMINSKYESTIHIDNDMVLQTVSKTRQLREFALSGDPAQWSADVMRVVEELEKGEETEEEPS